MMSETHLTPVFFDNAGVPFVFWDSSGMLQILHGRFLTVFRYGSPECKEGATKLYQTGKAEVMIHDRRGRVVASFLPSENALVIKRDGEIHVFASEQLILDYHTFDQANWKQTFDASRIASVYAGIVEERRIWHSLLNALDNKNILSSAMEFEQL